MVGRRRRRKHERKQRSVDGDGAVGDNATTAAITTVHALTVWYKEQDAWSDATMHGTLEELCFVEQQVEMTGSEEFRILEAVYIINVLIEHAEGQDGKRRVEKVVDRDEHWIKHRLSNIWQHKNESKQ